MEILFLIFLAFVAYFFFARDENREDESNDSTESSGAGNQSLTAVRPSASSGTHGSSRRAVGFIKALAEAAGLAVGAMAAIAVGTVVVGTVVAAHLIRAGLEEYQRVHGGVDTSHERERREQEIRDINSEISEYETKRFRDGLLSDYEGHELDELHRRREQRAMLLAETNGMIIAGQVAEGVGVYDNMHVSDVNTHILQFHVGQTVFGKACGRCGMPMVLQWQQRLNTVQMRDFFWGCAGFYDGKCRNVQPFMHSDMTLFTNTDREEFTISTSELTSIARLPQSVRLIRRRMDGLVSSCP